MERWGVVGCLTSPLAESKDSSGDSIFCVKGGKIEVCQK